MSRSRNFERSRKAPDEIRAHMLRESLMTEASQEEIDLSPIDIALSHKSAHSINIIETGARVQILITGETAHARLIA